MFNSIEFQYKDFFYCITCIIGWLLLWEKKGKWGNKLYIKSLFNIIYMGSVVIVIFLSRLKMEMENYRKKFSDMLDSWSNNIVGSV